jgi:hypothetical protein
MNKTTFAKLLDSNLTEEKIDALYAAAESYVNNMLALDAEHNVEVIAIQHWIEITDVINAKETA